MCVYLRRERVNKENEFLMCGPSQTESRRKIEIIANFLN